MTDQELDGRWEGKPTGWPALNRERGLLIDKRIAGTISEDEKIRLVFLTGFVSPKARLCARTEADAMIHQFFADHEFPPQAANALMMAFRGFRSELDAEPVEKSETDPELPTETA